MANFSDIAQIRILDLPGAIEPGAQALPLQPKDVGFADQERDDSSMLREANQNRLLSESFEASRGLIGTWNIAELMLRAYVEPVKWKGSDQFRSHLGMPIVAEHFYSLLSVIQQTLFTGYRPFQIDPAAGTTVDAAAAQEGLITAQMKHCGFKGGSIKQEIRHITYDCLLYGTGCGIAGWQQKKYKVMKKRQKKAPTTLPASGGTVEVPADIDDVEEYVASEREVNEPTLEHVPLRRIRVAPDCRRGEINTASWKGRLIYPSSYDLDQLRDVEGFDIPTREQLVALTTPQKMDGTATNPLDTQGADTSNPVFQQTTTPQKAYPENYSDGGTVDPLAKKFEVFEYVTDTRLVWVLEGTFVLVNRPHNNEVKYLSCVFREAPDSFYGYGLGFWLTDYQRIAQGVVNAFFDDLNLNLMGTYTSPAGLNNTAQAQWIFPGKVFKSDGQNKVEPMTRNSIQSQEPLSVIEQIRQWSALISSAGVGAQGQNTGQAGTMRTPAGVNLMASGEAMKTQDLIDQICDNVFVPWIEFCIEMNGKLKPSQLKMMLSEELGEAFKAQPLTVINGDYKVTISAGAKLQARHTIEQIAGFLVSLFQSPNFIEGLAMQGMKVDAGAFLASLMDAANHPYRENIIVKMTPDDQKRWEMTQQQPAHDIEKINAAAEAKKGVDNNQAENRAILETGKHVLKVHQLSVEEDAAIRAERVAQIHADQAETSAV